jgi:hypothetical protein
MDCWRLLSFLKFLRKKPGVTLTESLVVYTPFVWMVIALGYFLGGNFGDRTESLASEAYWQPLESPFIH